MRRVLAPARRPLVALVATGVLGSALVLAQAWSVAGLVVAALGTGSLRTWGLATVAVLAARGATTWAGDVLAARAAARVGNALRHRVVRAVLDRTTRGEPSDDTGQVAVLATRGVESVTPYVTRYLPALVLAVVLPPVAVVGIGTQDLVSAAVVAATLPLVPVFGALVGLTTRDRAARQWRALEALAGHFLDVVRGLPTLVAFRRAQAQSPQIARATDRYRTATSGVLRLAFASSAVLELVATLSVALVAVLVGVRLAGGSMELHPALVVLLLAPEAYWPLRRVGAEFHACADGIAVLEEVEALEPGTGAPDEQAAPAPADARTLQVRGLTVRHPGRPEVLHDLDLDLPAPGVTVVVGASGCGKTTLLHTLAGMTPSCSGTVVEGSAPGEDVRGPRWRTQVALLPQRPVLLAGAVAENLLLANPGATVDEQWQALRQVALEERVRALPHGLLTPLGEDGVTLSAGERARLALARVVISDRPWVFLDEPTAHLDPVTTQVVLDTVAHLGRTRGVVLAAHDDRVLDVADQVVRLDPWCPGPTRSPPRPPRETRPEAAGGTAGSAVCDGSNPGGPGGPGGPLLGASARTRLGVASALGAAASASGAALTVTAGWLIVQASTHPPVLTMLVAIVAVRAFGLARPVLRYAERLLSHDAALRLLAQRRVAVYDALVPLTPGALGRRAGDVLSSLVDDVDSVLDQELRVRLPVRSALAVATLATVVTWLVLPDAVPVAVALPALAGAAAWTAARFGARAAERRTVHLRAQLSAGVVETLHTAPELVLWQGSAQALGKLAEVGDALGRASTVSARWSGAARALVLGATGAAVALTALVARPHVGQDLSRPLLGLLVLLPLALVDVVLPLVDAGALTARTRAAAARLARLSATRPLVSDVGTGATPQGTGIRLDAVSAGWEPGHEVLRGLSLDLAPGARIAVTGPSGSGKTTLAALLVRYLDPSRGRVDLGGTPVACLRLDDLRSVVGLVDDDPHLFASTVAENIRLARPGAGDAEIAEALRLAHLSSWLESLPEGLDTWIGAGHATVSGGERARLGLARSLLADHQVLVLDEPVAHLDPATARLLAEEVVAGRPGRSIVWITHSPVGLDLVDSVVELGFGPGSDPGVQHAVRRRGPGATGPR